MTDGSRSLEQAPADGSLDGPITLGNNGLTGLIVINGANGAGQWNSNVTVGSTTLSNTPDYPEKASDLGGGAVGLVPYNVHREDCVPPHGEYAFRGDAVYATFYGRLTGTGTLATIDYHEPYTAFDDLTGGWCDADECFDVVLDPSNPRRLKVTIKPSFPPPPGMYRLIPTSNLKCHLGLTPEPAVMQTSYWFWLANDCFDDNQPTAADFTTNPAEDCNENGINDCCDILLGGFDGEDCELDRCDVPCPCDWDGSGKRNSQDFFDFLTDFFAGDADFNKDDFTNSQDFFDFLTCFFEGC